MKISFRVWSNVAPTLNARLATYPANLPLTDKMNLLLEDLLHLKDQHTPAPIPVVKGDPPPDSPYLCIRGFNELPDKDAQAVKCGTCKAADFTQWQACQEQRAEERRKLHAV